MSDLGEFVCQDFQTDAAPGQDISLPGDYYREHDNFTRGIAMSPALVGGMSSEACTGSFGSEYEKFFREPDDELRGISIGSAGGIGVNFFGNDMHAGHPGFDDQLGQLDPYEAKCATPCQAPNILKPAAPFTEEHSPPEKPKDKYFRLEVTHLVVNSERPHEIGNTLLDFFANTVTASLTKVRHAKFAIKADVFVGSVMCTVKARVYEEEAGRYAVEFQKRSGDALAYSSTWKQARSHLKSGVSKSPAEVDCSHQSAPNMQDIFPVPMSPVEVDDQILTPIHDMASFSEMPSIQAEAATALLGLAEGSGVQSRDSLSTEKMFETIDRLVQSDGKEVEYPTAKLLLVLLRRVELLSPEKPEVVRSFARLVLPGVLKKIVAKQTTELVQQKLLEVVYSVVYVCACAPAKWRVPEVEEALRRQVVGADAEPRIQEALAKALQQLEAA